MPVKLGPGGVSTSIGNEIQPPATTKEWPNAVLVSPTPMPHTTSKTSPDK